MTLAADPQLISPVTREPAVSSNAIAVDPLVSVVVCAHNAGPYLRPALRSLVNQTYRNIEVLLIDDGSTDGSVEAARREFDDPRIRWFNQSNAGKPAALNRALSEMRGEFYAIQDADDESFPSRIERQVRHMQENPDLAIVFCGYDLILNDRRVAPIFFDRSRERCRKMIDLYRLPQHDPTAMYRVSMVRSLRYEESFRLGEGIDYVMRIGERHPMVVMGECLYSYRVHAGGLTKKDPAHRLPFLKEVRRRAMVRRGIDPAVLDEGHEDLKPRAKWRNRDYDNNLAARFVESVVCLRGAGRPWQAIRTGLVGASLHPFDPYYWKALAYALLPLSFVRRVRRSWV